MRLDRFIAHATNFSRRDVQKLMKSGRVTVDGVQIKTNLDIHEHQLIAIDGEKICLPQPVYLMLHKPAGYLCANSDGQHPTVLDLIREKLHPTDPLQIVGRLDLDTTGLVLLTTDGQWNHRITSPNSHCHKQYRVDLAEPITAEMVKSLERGVLLRSEAKPTLPSRIHIIHSHQVTILIQEGRYHQVKRMFAAVGNHVEKLHREQIGDIQLDKDLSLGSYRHLTPEEIQSVWR